MAVRKLNTCGEEVELSYASGTYTVSVVKGARVFKSVSNSFEFARFAFESFLERSVDGVKEEGEAATTRPIDAASLSLNEDIPLGPRTL